MLFSRTYYGLLFTSVSRSNFFSTSKDFFLYHTRTSARRLRAISLARTSVPSPYARTAVLFSKPQWTLSDMVRFACGHFLPFFFARGPFSVTNGQPHADTFLHSS